MHFVVYPGIVCVATREITCGHTRHYVWPLKTMSCVAIQEISSSSGGRRKTCCSSSGEEEEAQKATSRSMNHVAVRSDKLMLWGMEATCSNLQFNISNISLREFV